MRPYWTIICDSFLHATRSKLLWLLLVGWSAILLALAPFGYVQNRNYKIAVVDLIDASSIRDGLTAAARGGGSAAQRAVVDQLDAESQKYWKSETSGDNQFSKIDRVTRSLNSVLDKPDLYVPEAFPRAVDRSTLKPLLEQPGASMAELDLAERNRSLLRFAFPGQIRAPDPTRVAVGYAGFPFSDPLPISKKQLKSFMLATLFYIMKIGLGIVAMLVAIIITSWLIPQMFQGGSLHLLLSKPVSRSLLFLAKFVGGCAFVTVNIVFVLVGLYFIAGFRLEIWNVGLLWCIPVFMLIFSIFYSVSALAGVIWKNEIICIVVVGLFWLFCFSVGFTDGIMQAFVVDSNRIELVHQSDDVLFASTRSGQLNAWDEANQEWTNAFGLNRGSGQVLGVFSLPESDKIIIPIGGNRNPFAGIEMGNIRMRVADLSDARSTSSDVNSATREPGDSSEIESEDSRSKSTEPETNAGVATDEPGETTQLATQPDKKSTGGKAAAWSSSRISDGPNFPPSTRRVRFVDNEMLVLAEAGIYRFNPESLNRKNEEKNQILRFLQELTPKDDAFTRLTDPIWSAPKPHDVAFSKNGEQCFVLYDRFLQSLKIESVANGPGDEPKAMFKPIGEPIELSDAEEPSGRMSINGDWLLIAMDDEVPFVVQTSDLERRLPIDSIGVCSPEAISAMPGQASQFAVLAKDGNLWQVDASLQQASYPRLIGQGDVSAMDVIDRSTLIVSYGIDEVARWDLSGLASENVVSPTLAVSGMVYHYIVHPFYLVCPKPSSLDNVMAAALDKSGEEAIPGLEEAELDYITPIWTNLVFISVMLLVSCVILYRQDL